MQITSNFLEEKSEHDASDIASLLTNDADKLSTTKEIFICSNSDPLTFSSHDFSGTTLTSVSNQLYNSSDLGDVVDTNINLGSNSKLSNFDTKASEILSGNLNSRPISTEYPNPNPCPHLLPDANPDPIPLTYPVVEPTVPTPKSVLRSHLSDRPMTQVYTQGRLFSYNKLDITSTSTKTRRKVKTTTSSGLGRMSARKNPVISSPPSLLNVNATPFIPSSDGNAIKALKDIRVANPNNVIFGQLNINSIRNKFSSLVELIHGNKLTH